MVGMRDQGLGASEYQSPAPRLRAQLKGSCSLYSSRSKSLLLLWVGEFGRVCLWRKLKHREEKYKFVKGVSFDTETVSSINKTPVRNKLAELPPVASSLARGAQR